VISILYLDKLSLTKPPVKSAAHFKKLPAARFFTSNVGENTALNADAFPVAILHSSSRGNSRIVLLIGLIVSSACYDVVYDVVDTHKN
jgi:hypothetical protein